MTPFPSLISDDPVSIARKPGEAVAVRLKLKVPTGTAAGTFFPFVTFSQGTAVPFTTASTTPVTVS